MRWWVAALSYVELRKGWVAFEPFTKSKSPTSDDTINQDTMDRSNSNRPQTLQEMVDYLQAHPEEAPPLGSTYGTTDVGRSDEPVFQPSKLGTKEHWDQVYEREVKMFKEIGDEGEVWFGEDSTEKMVDWIEDHLQDRNANILDLGTGNGQLLFRLSEQGYTCLTGIDYSPLSIELAESIQASKSSRPEPPIRFELFDLISAAPSEYDRMKERHWKLICDKGTYDAICLSDQEIEVKDPTSGNKEMKSIASLYPERVAGLMKPDDWFLITSCNWTRKELEKTFITPETGLVYDSHVPRPSFSFGGSTGSSITTIAFRKTQ